MPNVTIVGGGLAGMTAAIRLAERGCSVTLYEANAFLGGKASAKKVGDRYEEHGYHIFPMWYVNVWRLVDELGIRDNFVDRSLFLQLRAGEYPRMHRMENLTSWRYFPRNLFSGIMPIPQMVLFFYSTLDLMSQSFEQRALLDRISVSGFIRSRFYRTEEVAGQHQDLMLKGISVPYYEVSAMTMRHVMRYWVKSALPMYRILRGNMQQFFIDPIHRRLQELGVEIRLEQRLEEIHIKDSRVARLTFRDRTNDTRHEQNTERLILAIPVEKVDPLINDDLVPALSLCNLGYIRTRCMAALNLYLNRKLPNLPLDHVNLLNSELGLSFLDVAQTWDGYDTTVLNVIASDFTRLENVSEAKAIEEMVRELRRYLPDLQWSDIVKTHFESHIEEPLFMNDVAAWVYRPQAKTELENLYLAGDYCRSHIDLVCMEGAVTTGLLAAEAVRKDMGLEKAVEVRVPETYPQWLMTLGWLGLMPVAAVAKLAALLMKNPQAQLDINEAADPRMSRVERIRKRCWVIASPEFQRSFVVQPLVFKVFGCVLEEKRYSIPNT